MNNEVNDKLLQIVLIVSVIAVVMAASAVTLQVLIFAACLVGGD